MDNNLPANRGSRDSDNWVGRGSGRDSDKWGSRGGSRDSDGWGGRGRLSPWRGNSNRRRNEDWENPNQQKRWRRDDNPDWDEQQKPWKRGTINEEEDWQNNKQGSQWVGKKDETNYTKIKNRDSNDERPRKPSKWGDKDSDDNTKEDRWNRKPVEHISSRDESNTEEGPHQTSAPMDLDNYEGEAVDNIEQHHGVQEQETLSTNTTFKHQDEERHDLGVYNADSKNEDKKNVEQNTDDQYNNKDQQFEDYQNDFTNNSQELSYDNIKETQQNSQKLPIENFEQQHLEEKHNNEYEPQEEYQNDSKDDFNSQQENEMSQNNEEFVQTVQFKSDYSNLKYENHQPDVHQSFNEDSSHNSINEEHCSINTFVSQVNEANHDMNTEEKSRGTLDDFYFGADCESSVNMEQQNNEILPIEETRNVPPDNNEINDINTAE